MNQRRNYKIWTGDEVNFIRENRSKLTVPEIATALNSSPSKVQGIINRQSIYKRNKPEVIYPTRAMLKELSHTGLDYLSMVRVVELIKKLNP